MKPLTPYLMFNGNCREAMEFYQSCFGGELQVMTYGDAPEDACCSGTKLDEAAKNKVMHACLTSGDFTLMASDDSTGAPIVGSNISISIQPVDTQQTDKLFKALSVGGAATHAPTSTFWGAYFGMLTDKYGFRWMLNCKTEEQKAA